MVETVAEDIPLYVEFVGQTSGLKDIAIRARVEGVLEGVHFQEGRGVQKGDFVGRDPNPVILNTVSQVDTILVTFFITETQYLQLARFSPEDWKNYDEARANLELILIDGSLYKHWGKPDFVDRGVDTTTGAILVQASFPNPEKLLRPGLFVKLRSSGQIIKDGTLIPQRCVMETQGLFNVYVVSADKKIQTREVTVGSKIGSLWLITEGLKPGEMVVFEGLQKVRDGVIVNPTIVDTKTTELDNK